MTISPRKRILFVDDDPNVLDGIKRILRPMRTEWEGLFLQRGEEALGLLDRERVDVLVSDMQMTGMSGVELLAKVKERHPHVVRIGLSGTANQELILKSVCVAHQYLTKPCDSETLKRTVDRACRLLAKLQDNAVKTLVSRVQSLPSPPALYFEIVEELRSSDPSIKKIGEIISQDPSMCAKVLQLVNSSYFGLAQKVSDPERAVNLMGVDLIKGLVLSVKVFTKLKEDNFPPHFVEMLWKHSTRTGALSRRIAKRECKDQQVVDDSFVAGLLHDIGKLILAEGLPEKYTLILSAVQGQMHLTEKTEKEELGVTHAETGGYLLDLWGLPGPVVEAVTFHHDPSSCFTENFSPLTAVHVSNVITVFYENLENGSPQEPRDALDFSLWEKFGLDVKYLSELNLLDRLPHWLETYREFEQEP